MIFRLFLSQSKKGYPPNLIKCLAEEKVRQHELTQLRNVGQQIRKQATWIGLER